MKKMPEPPGEGEENAPRLLRAGAFLPLFMKRTENQILFFCQRNQYSGAKWKFLGRFALHPSACALGAGEEGRVGTDVGQRCAASHEFPSDFPGAPCPTGIARYKAKAVAKDKSGRDKQSSFRLPLHSRVSLRARPNFGGQ